MSIFDGAPTKSDAVLEFIALLLVNEIVHVSIYGQFAAIYLSHLSGLNMVFSGRDEALFSPVFGRPASDIIINRPPVGEDYTTSAQFCFAA